MADISHKELEKLFYRPVCNPTEIERIFNIFRPFGVSPNLRK
jgi:hypothetical protein